MLTTRPSRASRRAAARRARGRTGLVVAVLLLAGCKAPAVEAVVVNESGQDGLTAVVVTDGLDAYTAALDEQAHLDTQWVHRELQCLVEQDGHLEVRDAAGAVVARHDFVDRPVCDDDVIVLGADGTLTWQ